MRSSRTWKLLFVMYDTLLISSYVHRDLRISRWFSHFFWQPKAFGTSVPLSVVVQWQLKQYKITKSLKLRKWKWLLCIFADTLTFKHMGLLTISMTEIQLMAVCQENVNDNNISSLLLTSQNLAFSLIPI